MGDMADDTYDMALADDFQGRFNKVWKKEIFKKMSNEMIGKVTKVTKDAIKTGKNSGKNYYKVTVENEHGEQFAFNAWEWSAISDIRVGMMAHIDFEYSPDRKWKHIVSATPVTDVNDDLYSPTEKAIETPTPPPVANRASSPDFSGLRIVPDNRELGIYRQSALKGAIEYHAKEEVDIETLLETAKRFVEFDLTGE